MSALPVETGDTIVVTVLVPCEDADELAVGVLGHEVTVTGPHGFRHDLTLPVEADMAHVSAQLYAGLIELRAPRLSMPLPRLVPVRSLASAESPQ
jgi:HSP20 family molecular chaperone IbpA